MSPSNGTTVLIIDRSHDWAAALRERLVEAGLRVHVVDTRETAIRFATVKRIDVAVLDYAIDGWTDKLCADLKRRGIPYIFTAEGSRSSLVPQPFGAQPTASNAAI
jgi:DNA-binding response OmpR family regulator